MVTHVIGLDVHRRTLLTFVRHRVIATEEDFGTDMAGIRLKQNLIEPVGSLKEPAGGGS